jgi:hypothetical protein
MIFSKNGKAQTPNNIMLRARPYAKSLSGITPHLTQKRSTLKHTIETVWDKSDA